MKTLVRYSSISCAVMCCAFLPAGPTFAQAYVNQASPPGLAGSVYLEQVPPGARPKAPAVSSRKAPPRQAVAADAAVVASGVEPFKKPRYPDVAAGSSAIVQSSEMDWPTVGRGTVNR